MVVVMMMTPRLELERVAKGVAHRVGWVAVGLGCAQPRRSHAAVTITATVTVNATVTVTVTVTVTAAVTATDAKR